MILFKLMWELALRLFWGAMAFVLLLLVGYCVTLPTLPTQKERDQRKISACNYVMQAAFSISGHSVVIPAVEGTMIDFPYSGETPNRGLYIHVETVRPWDKDILEFCGEQLTGRGDPKLVKFERKALEGLAAKLGLPSSNTIKRLTIGTIGLGTWLIPADVKDDIAPDMMLAKTKQFSGHNTIWQFLATAGWLDSGHRLSSWCIKFKRDDFVRCNVRVTRRSDGVVFEAWGLHMDEMPQKNVTPPEEFLVLAERLPDILELFKAPDTP